MPASMVILINLYYHVFTLIFKKSLKAYEFQSAFVNMSKTNLSKK